MEEDMGAFEIEVPDRFDWEKFKKDSEAGIGKFWLICTEDSDIGYRFRGLMHPENHDLSDVRVFIDVISNTAFINAPWKQSLSKLQIAREAAKVLRATHLFKEGIEIGL